MAKITMSYNGTDYEIETHLDFNGSMVCGNIYKVVRPTWKIFRTSYRDHFCFWISDFETVREGVEFCFADYIKELQRIAENYKKYDDFVKGA